jgi:hypothetical protein
VGDRGLPALHIRVLCDYRDQLISERTRMINRLRWHLVTIAPEIEAQVGQAALKRPRDLRLTLPPARAADPEPAAAARSRAAATDHRDRPRGTRPPRRARHTDRRARFAAARPTRLWDRDRQLNRALHIIALSRARTDPETRIYLDRKHAEGKTRLEAIRCLKRHLARRIWRLLYTTTTPGAPPELTNRKNPQIALTT